ncbi:MAG: hypothetical protein EXR11_10655 [Rhodospirillaceae bacterium]|nr:hypothetical protein [Rhodospirillaceae bacterium]
MSSLPHTACALLVGKPAIAETEWPSILAAYAQTQRHYHTWAHILAVLSAADAVTTHVQTPRGFYLACVYHDIVYEPGAKNNEALSAARLREAFAAGRIDASDQDIRVATALIETSGGEGRTHPTAASSGTSTAAYLPQHPRVINSTLPPCVPSSVPMSISYTAWGERSSSKAS